MDNLIECVGYKKNPYSYFEHCKIFCLTSLIEGFPTTLVETMNFGKPFVSTQVAGTKELAENGECGIVALNDEEYITGLIQLLTDNNKYEKMSKNCKKTVKKYSIENQIAAIEECIESI